MFASPRWTALVGAITLRDIGQCRPVPRTIPPLPMNNRSSLDLILAAAGELFAQQGFSKTTMAEVAEKACVSKGLPYVYFPSKRHLLEAVQLRAVENWFAETQRHLNQKQDRAIDSLRKSFKYSILYSAKDPVCRALMAQDSKVLLPDSEKVRAEIMRLNDEGFRAMLTEAIRDGDIRNDIGIDELMLMWRVTHDTLIHAQTDRLSWMPRNGDLEHIIDSAMDILFHGMVPAARGTVTAKRAV